MLEGVNTCFFIGLSSPSNFRRAPSEVKPPVSPLNASRRANLALAARTLSAALTPTMLLGGTNAVKLSPSWFRLCSTPLLPSSLVGWLVDRLGSPDTEQPRQVLKTEVVRGQVYSDRVLVFEPWLTGLAVRWAQPVIKPCRPSCRPRERPSPPRRWPSCARPPSTQRNAPSPAPPMPSPQENPSPIAGW